MVKQMENSRSLKVDDLGPGRRDCDICFEPLGPSDGLYDRWFRRFVGGIQFGNVITRGRGEPQIRTRIVLLLTKLLLGKQTDGYLERPFFSSHATISLRSLLNRISDSCFTCRTGASEDQESD